MIIHNTKGFKVDSNWFATNEDLVYLLGFLQTDNKK